MPHAVKESVSKDFFDPAHYPALQTHFDTVRMGTGFGQNSLYNAFGELACALILLLYNFYACPHVDIGAVIASHSVYP
jgi:hypothetical protein